ncbi:MAG: saccharopine dehydrogenase NADP-binding domain-containing protein [Candidatus Kapabacteria bacterium]|nr:saccharopine dehydrogenase NADP-binding domain-containing protein [Candidatus Kapabacteria bacterium]
MKKVTVLGSGMVGSAIAIDLSNRFKVTVADKSQDHLAKLIKLGIPTTVTDLSKYENIAKVVSDADLVIGAVPGFMGYQTLEYVIEAGKNVVDISFFPEDAYTLDSKAKAKKLTAIVDMGVAPGMDNFLLGHHVRKMEVTDFKCYVGGLPKLRSHPFQYKAPFSPVDVLEEYTRPARFVENSHLVVKPALTDPEYLEFDGIGTLEAFNTDGLRTIMRNIKAPNMIEKTLRWPGHIDLMRAIIKAGFLDTNKIQIGNVKISPMEFTSHILFDNWRLNPGDLEFTVMRVEIAGNEDGQNVKYTYDVYDETDIATGTSSMARTTGYTATAVASMFLEGMFDEKGIIAPEMLPLNDDIYEYVMNYQLQRKIYYNIKKQVLS